jgi:hypothetical protein
MFPLKQKKSKKIYKKSLKLQKNNRFKSIKCERTMDNPSFITFGCWNKKICNLKSPDNNVSKVMNKINKLCNSTYPKPSFIVVAGDNYYPEITKVELTGEKIKTIKESELKSGFDCLFDIYQKHKIPIDLIAGNHDLVHTDKYRINYIDPSENGLERDKCFITNSEINLANFPVNSFSLCNYRLFGRNNHTLVLMIDSNIYNESILDIKDCFIYLLQTTIKNFNNDKELLDKLERIKTEFNTADEQLKLKSTKKEDKEQIEERLKYMLHDFQVYCIQSILKKINKKQIKNVVVIAHHPLVYYKVKSKSKKEERPQMLFANSDYIILCKNIYDYFNKDTQLFYNSADLHLYQEGYITLKSHLDDEIQVRQYIAGTGGNTLEDQFVELSDLPKNNYQCVNINGMNVGYKMTNTIKSNGFLHWNEDIKNKKLSIKFIKA